MTTEAIQTYSASHKRIATVADAEMRRFTAAQDGHPLSPCAAAFCDGDLARYLELYHVVFRAAHETPRNTERMVLSWNSWLVALFQDLRIAFP
jgi:hypothetical protein